jgi:hypothetical protein
MSGLPAVLFGAEVEAEKARPFSILKGSTVVIRDATRG